MQPQDRNHSSIDIIAVPGLLPLFFAPQGIRGPKVPRRRLPRSGLVPCFFLLFFVPQATVPSSSHKAHHHDASLSCRALCHAIGAYAAACTTANSEPKKCLMIGDGALWLPSRVVLCPCSCLCVRCVGSSNWEDRYLQQFCWHAPRNGSSPVSEPPYCGLQAFPVSVPCCNAFWSPTMGW